MSTPPRTVRQVVNAHRQLEGGGFVVRRPFPSPGIPLFDPFLLLDELGPVDHGPGEAVGAPDHPHRGFETVTYMLDGEIEHEDSAGHRGRIGPGDVQWMTAGAGVIHSELPGEKLRREGGGMHGFQLWVNLPQRDKMMRPRYQELTAAQIPKARTPDGRVEVAVIAGEALGVAAAIDTRTPILYQDFTVHPGGRVVQPVPAAWQGFAFVFSGSVRIADRPVDDGQMAILGPGDTLEISSPSDSTHPARLLLIAGEPLGEPVARYGPFVMNTEQEIQQAIRDFQSGRMGEISR